MNHESGTEDNRKYNPDDKHDSPHVIGWQSMTKSNKPPPNSDCSKSDDRPKSPHARIKYWLELAGIIFGVGGVICLVVQSCAMFHSNAIFSQQLKEMQDTRKLDERAWVFADVKDNSLVQNGTNYVVQIELRNVGKTPAVITGDWESVSPYMNMISNVDPMATGEHFAVIPNRFQIINSPPLPIPTSSEQIIFVWGTVYYKDIFGGNHWSQFCYALANRGREAYTVATHWACDDTERNQTKQEAIPAYP